jgi:hypothetical protein
MRRIALATVFATLFLTQAARADEIATVPADAVLARVSPVAQAEPTPSFLMPTRHDSSRPALLAPMYGGLIALQAYDVYSTTTALNHGAREANPIMGGVAGNPIALAAVKAAVTGTSIFAAERMWKQGHRAQAVAVMIISNGLMAAVAAHNHAVIGQVR